MLKSRNFKFDIIFLINSKSLKIDDILSNCCDITSNLGILKGNIKLNHKIKNHKIKTLIKNEVLDFSY